MDLWLRDVAFAFSTLVGKNASWVGSSIGAWIALILGQQRPEWFSSTCGLGSAIDWDAYYLNPGIDNGTLKIEQDLVVSGSTPLMPVSLLSSMAKHRIADQRRVNSVPVTLIHGEDDATAPLAAVKAFTASANHRATVLEVVAGGHDIAKLAAKVEQARFQAWLETLN